MDLPRRVQLLLGDQQAGLGKDMPLHLDPPPCISLWFDGYHPTSKPINYST